MSISIPLASVQLALVASMISGSARRDRWTCSGGAISCRSTTAWWRPIRARSAWKRQRQIVRDYLAAETLHALAKRHDLSRNLVRIWIEKFEPGAFDDEAVAADTIWRSIALPEWSA